MDTHGSDGAVDPRVHDLLAAAGAADPAGSPLPGEDAALAVFRSHQRARWRARRRRTVIAGATAAFVLTGGTAAAAMTGSLPGPAQRIAHDVLDRVGVSVPDGGPEQPTAPGLERRLTVPPAKDGILPPGLEQAVPGDGATPDARPTEIPSAQPTQRPAQRPTQTPPVTPPSAQPEHPAAPAPDGPERPGRTSRPERPEPPAEPPRATPDGKPTTRPTPAPPTPTARPTPPWSAPADARAGRPTTEHIN